MQNNKIGLLEAFLVFLLYHANVSKLFDHLRFSRFLAKLLCNDFEHCAEAILPTLINAIPILGKGECAMITLKLIVQVLILICSVKDTKRHLIGFILPKSL